VASCRQKTIGHSWQDVETIAQASGAFQSMSEGAHARSRATGAMLVGLICKRTAGCGIWDK